MGENENNASQSDSKSLEGKAGRQDFGDKNGALRAEAREHTQAYVTEADSSQSPFLAQKPTPQEPEIVLDFFAGSGTTAHAVMELNREDGGKRQCILVTNNEKTELNPQGIAIDVTSKRLKRIMSGECYDGSRDFKWIEKNEPYGGRLEVYEVKAVADTDQNVFKKIDEGCYGLRFDSSPKGVQDKIEWVCRNFELTCKSLESNDTDSANKGE